MNLSDLTHISFLEDQDDTHLYKHYHSEIICQQHISHHEYKYCRYEHMTFEEAARLAREAGVKELWLTHYSPALGRPEMFMDDVRAIFPNAHAGKDRMSRELNFEEGVSS